MKTIPLFSQKLLSVKDIQWLERFKTKLKPWVTEGCFTTWDETNIMPGYNTSQEISDAIKRARLAVCLVTSDFLADDVVRERVLKPLLERKRNHPLSLQWIAIKSALYEASPFKDIKPLNDEKKPLAVLDEAEQDAAMVDLSRQIRAIVSPEETTQSAPQVSPKQRAAYGIDDPVDVVVLTAVKDEYDAARRVEDGAQADWLEKKDQAGLAYAVRDYRTQDGGRIRIALARAVNMGAADAAATATRLVNELKPRCLAMCGVCAGRKGKVTLGDVIVADRMFFYDNGKLEAYINQENKIGRLCFQVLG